MSSQNTSRDHSQDFDANGYADDGLDFNSPMFTLACQRHSFNPDELVKKTFEQIKQMYKNKKYGQEAYRLIAKHYEEKRHLKIKIILKERNNIIEEKINEIHEPLHYRGKTIIYALGASANCAPEPKIRRELRELMYRQEGELERLLLHEKDLGRDNYSRVKAAEREQAMKQQPYTTFLNATRDIELIEPEEFRKLRAPKKQSRTDKKIQKTLFEKQFGIPFEPYEKQPASSQKQKGHRNYLEKVEGNLLESRVVFRTRPHTPAQPPSQRASSTKQQKTNEKKHMAKTIKSDTKPVSGRTSGLPPKQARREASTRPVTPATATPVKKLIMNSRQESENKQPVKQSVKQLINFDDDSSDEEWEHGLASSYKRNPSIYLTESKENSKRAFTTPKKQSFYSTAESWLGGKKELSSKGMLMIAKGGSQNKGISDSPSLGMRDTRISEGEDNSYSERSLHQTELKRALVGSQIAKDQGMKFGREQDYGVLSLISSPKASLTADKTMSFLSSAKRTSFERSDGFEQRVLYC